MGYVICPRAPSMLTSSHLTLLQAPVTLPFLREKSELHERPQGDPPLLSLPFLTWLLGKRSGPRVQNYLSQHGPEFWLLDTCDKPASDVTPDPAGRGVQDLGQGK